MHIVRALRVWGVLGTMGNTSGRASSGTHPLGQRACSPEPLKVAATPPDRSCPPRTPHMVDMHATCRWGPARGVAPAHVDPEPACQPAGALNTSSCACLRGDQVEAGLERWQHAFGRWAPATIHLSAPVYAVHAVAAARKPVWVRPSGASIGALQTCVYPHAQPSCQLPPHPPAQSRLLEGRPSVAGGVWCLH